MKVEIQARSILHLVAAVAVAMLLYLVVGTLIGLAEWPVLRIVERRANNLAGVAGMIGNLIPGVVVFGILEWARRGHLAGRPSFFGTAAVVTLITMTQLVFGFVGGEISWLIFTPLANAALITPSSLAFALLSREAVPLLILVILFFSLRRSEPEDAA